MLKDKPRLRAGSPGVGLLGCWDVGLLGCWDVGLLGCWDDTILFNIHYSLFNINCSLFIVHYSLKWGFGKGIIT